MPEIFVTLAAAALLLLGLRLDRKPSAKSRLNRRRIDAGWCALAVLAVVVHTDFFDFHGGGGVYLHAHDAGHYYLGARYFPELGYTGLYGAMLAAEVDAEGGTVTRFARDLDTGVLTLSSSVLAEGRRYQQRFSQERWHDFRRDADHFRAAMGPLYANFVLDHGFNTTPFWAFVAGGLASLVTPGDAAGIFGLVLLDLALIVAMLGGIAVAFGHRTALIATVFLATAFGGSFDWLGGAFLRYAWLTSAVLAVCCLAGKRHKTAGALLAVSACLRLFPAVFVLGAAVTLASHLWTTRRTGRCVELDKINTQLHFLGSFAAVCCLLIGLTLFSPHHGLAAWLSFAMNMSVYLESVAFNLVGLGTVVGSVASLFQIESAGTALLARVLGLGVLALAVALARQKRDVEALALGCLVLWGVLEMAVYYYLVLVVVVIAERHRPRLLALLFIVEAATWTAVTMLGAGTSVHVMHSLLLALFFGVAYIDEALDLLGFEATAEPPTAKVAAETVPWL